MAGWPAFWGRGPAPSGPSAAVALATEPWTLQKRDKLLFVTTRMNLQSGAACVSAWSLQAFVAAGGGWLRVHLGVSRRKLKSIV